MQIKKQLKFIAYGVQTCEVETKRVHVFNHSLKTVDYVPEAILTHFKQMAAPIRMHFSQYRI